MLTSHLTPRTRSTATSWALLLIGATLILSGCANSTAATQTELDGFGALTLTTKVCVGTTECVDKPAGGDELDPTVLLRAAPALRIADVEEPAPASSGQQRLIGYRIANDLVEPAALRSLDKGSVTYSRNAAYGAELERLVPSGDDTRWVGYTSSFVPASVLNQSDYRVAADFDTTQLAATDTLAAQVVTGFRAIAPDLGDLPFEAGFPFGTPFGELPIEDIEEAFDGAASSIDDPITCGDLDVEGDVVTPRNALIYLVGLGLQPLCIDAGSRLPGPAAPALTEGGLIPEVRFPSYTYPTEGQLQDITRGTQSVRTLTGAATGVEVTAGAHATTSVRVGVGLPTGETRAITATVTPAFAGTATLDQANIAAEAGVTQRDLVLTVSPAASAAAGASSVAITLRSGDVVIRTVTVPVTVRAASVVVAGGAPAAANPAAANTAVRDTAAPTLAFLDWRNHRSSRALDAGAVKQKIRIGEAGTVVATLTNALPANAAGPAKAKSRVTVFAKGTFRLTKQGAYTLALTSTEAGRTKVVPGARARSFRARLTLVATDAAGNTRLVRRVMWIEVPAAD
ncbi:MAG: hypothetical protein JWN72_925 [Thermoleophilia bacterium]|nr:hypothetical protein [Thermoleophilia bacterium]